MNKKDLARGRINEFVKTFNPPNTPIWPPSTKGPAHPVHSPSTTDGGSTVYPLPDIEEIPPTVDCPFCPIARKTPWYLHDIINDIVVCQDLNSRDYKLRILIVGTGTRWHEPWLSLQQVHRDLFVALADAFAAYAITKGHAKELHHLEHDFHSSYPEHAHIQACLT